MPWTLSSSPANGASPSSEGRTFATFPQKDRKCPSPIDQNAGDQACTTLEDRLFRTDQRGKRNLRSKQLAWQVSERSFGPPGSPLQAQSSAPPQVGSRPTSRQRMQPMAPSS